MPVETRENRVVERGALVIYTAITGDYDLLKRQPEKATSSADLVAFVDGENLDSNTGWRCQTPEGAPDDPARNSKIYKIMSHRYFPDKEYSLWLDGSVVIEFAFPVERLVSMYLADHDVAVFRHSRRTCLYQEAQAVMRQHLDDRETIQRQVETYTCEEYPANAGLAENCVLLRRHTAKVREFNEAWWEEIQRGSRRDQVSFNYVAWKCGLKYRCFPGSIEEPNGLFRKYPHRDQTRQARVRKLFRFIGGACGRLLSPVVLPMAAALGRRELRAKSRRSQPLSNTPFGEAAGSVGSSATKLRPRTSLFLSGERSPTIAFGPERRYPSWGWVGYDTARELSKAFRIIVYDTGQPSPPDCDVLFIIKERPRANFIAEARDRGSRIVYCPIDFYMNREQLDHDADFLRACDMVLVHCERHLPLVRTHCPETHFVEHHGRYLLPEMADFKKDGFVLWIGACQYLAGFLSWLELHPIGNEVKILTDLDNAWAARGARRFSTLSLMRGGKTLAGCEIHNWSERRQLEMMRECKAAIDVKQLEEFNQYFKPPTKAQKYVGSGIALAVNPGSYAEEYFFARGFPVASPEQISRWLSRQYWEQTREFGLELRASISLEAVGKQYRDLIESIL